MDGHNRKSSPSSRCETSLKENLTKSFDNIGIDMKNKKKKRNICRMSEKIEVEIIVIDLKKTDKVLIGTGFY